MGDDPLVIHFGKDVATLIYQWRYRLMMFDVSNEYRQLQSPVSAGLFPVGVQLIDDGSKNDGSGFYFNYRTMRDGKYQGTGRLYQWKTTRSFRLPQNY